MALRLEVFETAPRKAGTTVVVESDVLEEERLASFDKGYAAAIINGWIKGTEPSCDCDC